MAEQRERWEVRWADGSVDTFGEWNGTPEEARRHAWARRMQWPGAKASVVHVTTRVTRKVRKRGTKT